MYQVLYRKWRPQTFSDVSGQTHVTSTLKNEIRQGRLGHAYLFTGSRGTGKTTCAKILAKAVNCLNPRDGDPCNECDICKGIDDGSIMDVVEIDAASNNGVDNIRELREAAAFTPASGKYRVYIIDEVHMLSTGAFNALLKTLEEPPAHVLFILATTEVHKLPATILSRCQRFDFHRISPEDIASRIEFVAEKENMKLHHDAALLIARFADGALRDALSILDRCADCDEITLEKVSESVGLAGRDHLFSVSDTIIKKDSSAALKLVDELHNSSRDMERLCIELISHFRSLMLAKTVNNPSKLIICTEEELRRLMNTAHELSLETILHAGKTFQNALENIHIGMDARTEIETALLSLCSPQTDDSIPALLSRIAALEQQVRLLSSQATTNTIQKVESDVPIQTTEENNTSVNVYNKNEEQEEHTLAQNNSAVPLKSDILETHSTNNDEALEAAEQAAERYRYLQYEAEPPADEQADNNNNTRANTSFKPEPVINTTPQSTANTVEQNTSIAKRFEQWPEVIAALSKINPLVASLLRGSSAYEDGNMLLISCDHPQFKDQFNHNPIYRENLKTAALNVSGRQFKLGPYVKNKDSTKVSHSDPLADFLNNASLSGININNLSNTEAD